MSCESNSGRVSQAGAVAAGVPAEASRNSYISGVMMAKVKNMVATIQDNVQPDVLADRSDHVINRIGETVSPLINTLTGVIADPERLKGGQTLVNTGLGAAQVWQGEVATANDPLGLEKIAKNAGRSGLAIGGFMSQGGFKSPEVMVRRMVCRAFKERITAELGSRLAEATKTAEVGTIGITRRKFRFFKREEIVSLWRSKLTPSLNRMDVIGTVKGENIVSSKGVMLRIGKETWHCGATVVKMPGGKRTITHLQSFKSPATHYFFERSLSGEQAAGLAGGVIQPESVPGFVGSISRKESLLPAWANVKRGMLLMRLHWPPGPKKKTKKG